MQPRTFVGLVMLTAVVLVASVFGVVGRYSSDTPDRAEAFLFEGLADKAGEIKEIAVTLGDGRFTIKQEDSGWVLVEKNYPARVDKVSQVVRGLAGLRLMEAKTKMPERFQRLGLRDVDNKASHATLVRLKDGSGATLAELIVGRTRVDLPGSEKNGVYVRMPGQMQTWLARGRLDVGKSAQDWMLREIVDIPSIRVNRVITRAADGSTLTISKTAKSDRNFTIEGLPPGATLSKNALTTMDSMGAALTGLELVDVAAVTDKDFAKERVSKAEVRTIDGLVIHLTLAKIDKQTWAKITASADADLVAKEVEAINRRVGGWAYQVAPHVAKYLGTTLPELLKPKDKDKSS